MISSWYYAIVALVLAASIYKYIEYKGLALRFTSAVFMVLSFLSFLSFLHCQPAMSCAEMVRMCIVVSVVFFSEHYAKYFVQHCTERLVHLR